MFKFTKGRQDANYYKCKLWSFWRIDGWIIKCDNEAIPEHVDPVKDRKHFRLNITIKGRDKFHGKAIFKWWRVCFFRPDINPHSVEKGSWTMLSFGFAI
jgi:hypothetical protein